MITDTNLHTDYVGGVSFEEQIYLSYPNDKDGFKTFLGNIGDVDTKKVKARLCPKCGLVETYIDLDSNE